MVCFMGMEIKVEEKFRSCTFCIMVYRVRLVWAVPESSRSIFIKECYDVNLIL